MKKHKEYFRVLVELSKAEAELFKMRSGVGDYELLHLREASNLLEQVNIQLSYAMLAREDGR